MNTHVFVVDATTFKLHLEYMFAGTGAKTKKSPFLEDAAAYCHHSTERNLVSMIADISRVRPGDRIVFYLQATGNNPGMFFGVFKAESVGFFDENDDDNYLKKELGKGLSFRIRISPDVVYPRGITEHDYLDDLTGKESPHQLCWSMIYRKLKGNRGCTMITQYESEDLLNKLDTKNNGQSLTGSNFSFDAHNVKIVTIAEEHQYEGRMNSLDIEPRLLHKAHKGNAFETHLQALIMQRYDAAVIKDVLLTLTDGSTWVGNEVSCGVGMQRIDTLLIEENDAEIHVKIVELKDEEPYDYILDEQLPWYLKWVSQYIIPNLLKDEKTITVHPCIIAKKTGKKKIIDRIKSEELISLGIPGVDVVPTEYIGFSISDSGITFEKII